MVRSQLVIPRQLALLLDNAIERERQRSGVKIPRHEMVEALLWRSFAGRGA
jgi:hypothetical protein